MESKTDKLPKEFKKFTQLAEALLEKDKYEEAIFYTNKAIELCPANIKNKFDSLSRKGNRTDITYNFDFLCFN